jgi:serine/threonine protein kinase
MHRVGVCHRDLKPDNILHDRRSGHLKIIDLGISKLIYNKKKDTKEKMWTVTGTLQYKAPEMFLGEEYDELVDSWAVGVITYQIMYGRMPF